MLQETPKWERVNNETEAMNTGKGVLVKVVHSPTAVQTIVYIEGEKWNAGDKEFVSRVD